MLRSGAIARAKFFLPDPTGNLLDPMAATDEDKGPQSRERLPSDGCQRDPIAISLATSILRSDSVARRLTRNYELPPPLSRKSNLNLLLD
jgi:hypothetical protein